MTATMNYETSGETVAPPTPAPPAKPRPAWRHPAVRLGGSAIILALLILMLPRQDLIKALRSVPPLIWPVAMVAYLSSHLVGVWKWRTLVNAAGAGLEWRDAVRAYYGGLFGNTFLPSIVGGDVVRAGLAFNTVKSKSALVLGSLLDRIQDVVWDPLESTCRHASLSIL